MTSLSSILKDGQNVDMPALRAWLATTEAKASQAAVAVAAATIGDIVDDRVYDSADQLPDAAFAGAYALVTFDPDETKIGLWKKTGATGSPGWIGPSNAMRGPGLTSEQQAQVDVAVEIANAAARTVQTIAERESIPVVGRIYGLHVYVVEQGRAFVWSPLDADDPDNDPGQYTGNEWVAQRNDAELLNLGNATGALNQSQINGLPQAIDGLDAKSDNIIGQVAAVAGRALHVSSIKVAPATLPPGGAVASATVSFKVAGQADGAYVEWANGRYRAYVDPAAASVTIPPNWGASTIALAIGDSLAFYSWTIAAAAAAGLTLRTPAIYTQDLHKQALAVGAYAVRLTLPGNYLPGDGAATTVTLLNGLPTDYDNPDAFLSTFPEDATPDGHASTGTLYGAGGSRKVTISHLPAGEPSVYHIASEPGAAAMTVPPGSLFVPDYAALMATSEIWIQDDALYPLEALEAIVRMTRRRVLILSSLNDAGNGTGSALLAARKAANQTVRERYPQYYVVDSQGRDVRQRLLASGGVAGNDAIDRANEVIPRSLREDGLHPNAAGKAVITQIVAEFRAANPAPGAIVVDEGIAVTVVNSLGPDTQTTRILPVQDVAGMQAEIEAAVLEALVDAPAGFAPETPITANTLAVSGGQYAVATDAPAITLTLPASGGRVIVRGRDIDMLNGNGRAIAGQGGMTMAMWSDYIFEFRVVGGVWAFTYDYLESGA